MPHINSAMLKLLGDLSPEARDYIEISDTELSARVARTRLIVEQAGHAKTPIHWLNRKLEPRTDFDRPPDLEKVPELWRRVFVELSFFGSMVYEVMGVRVETWIGPEGFIEAEVGEGKVFLAAIFQDHQRIHMFRRDEIAEMMAESDPDAITLWQSDDPRADYVRLLEACAAYGRGANTQPLYRHNDVTLARALDEYIDVHGIPTDKAKYLLGLKPMWAAAKLAEKFTTAVAEKASPLHRYSWPVVVREDGVRVTCECGKENRIPHEKLGAKAKCGGCSQPLETLRFPIVVESEVGFNRVVDSATIPVLVDFWAPWCGPCIAAVPALRTAAKQSDDQFAILWTSLDDYQYLGSRFDVQAVPTVIRMVDGKETHRHAGVLAVSQIASLAIDGSTP